MQNPPAPDAGTPWADPEGPTEPAESGEPSGAGTPARASRWCAAGRGVGRGVGRGTRESLRVTARAGRGSYRLVRRASQAEGAGESGLSRLFEVHAVSSAGDAAVALALAGSLFFKVPTGEARGQVAMFLGLTLLPFVVIAPLIGPFLDRFRQGRRWAIGTTMALRAFLAWVLAGSVQHQTAWQFPAALGVLICAKAYGVTRSSATPRLTPPDLTLVQVNGRMSIAGLAGTVSGSAIGGAAAYFGSAWALRAAFAIFIVGAIQAVLLPARVDSSAGEVGVSMGDLAGGNRWSSRIRFAVPSSVVTALQANAGLRMLSGFLTIFMAFVLRAHPFPGWHSRVPVLLALVIGAAGFGGFIGTVLGSLLRSRTPGRAVLVALAADALISLVAGAFYHLWLAVLLGLVVGVGQQLGKLALDSMIQDQVPEAVRTSVFARSETVLQVAWVFGGCLGIVLPLRARIGLGGVGLLLAVWFVAVLVGRNRRARRRPAASQGREVTENAAGQESTGGPVTEELTKPGAGP